VSPSEEDYAATAQRASNRARGRFKARYSPSVPEAGQLALSPDDVLVRSSASLIFSLEDGVKLLQVGEKGFVVVRPSFVLRTLRLEAPGSSGFDHPDFALGPVVVPFYPGMAVVHSL
jgi:hypothetical protein